MPHPVDPGRSTDRQAGWLRTVADEVRLFCRSSTAERVAERRNVSMYRTNRPCRAAGRLSGPLVVSMRPVPAELVPTAVQVTARMPQLRGARRHVGSPSGLGIAEPSGSDLGDPVDLAAFRPPFAITHAPGHMFVTDAPAAAYRQL